MHVDQVRRIASRKLSPTRTVGHAAPLTPQLVLGVLVFFVDFKLDEQPDFQLAERSIPLRLPDRLVKKHILTKILGIDEPKFPFGSTKRILSQATALDQGSTRLVVKMS